MHFLSYSAFASLLIGVVHTSPVPFINSVQSPPKLLISRGFDHPSGNPPGPPGSYTTQEYPAKANWPSHHDGSKAVDYHDKKGKLLGYDEHSVDMSDPKRPLRTKEIRIQENGNTKVRNVKHNYDEAGLPKSSEVQEDGKDPVVLKYHKHDDQGRPNQIRHETKKQVFRVDSVVHRHPSTGQVSHSTVQHYPLINGVRSRKDAVTEHHHFDESGRHLGSTVNEEGKDGHEYLKSAHSSSAEAEAAAQRLIKDKEAKA